MTTSNTLKEKLTSMAENLIRGRLNLLAAVLASNGASTEEQHKRLDQLVIAVREASVTPQLEDDSGNPVPVDVRIRTVGEEDVSVLVFNESMLRSLPEITDEILINSLAQPISKMLKVPIATVALTLHEKDPDQLQALSFKLAGSVDAEVINYTSLKTVQSFLLKRFLQRIARVSEVLSGGLNVEVVSDDAPGMEELTEHMATFNKWPSWKEIRGDETTDLSKVYAQPLNQVVQNTCQALSQTSWLSSALKVIKIVWNCSDLAERSFLVEAGRRLRSLDIPCPDNVLVAIAEAIGSDCSDLSLRLEDWPRFDELQLAIEKLYSEESAIFGAACEHRETSRKPVSVIDIASRAFGISEPKELPWNMPLLCWTQRETDALRDLYLGKCKTTYGMVTRSSGRRTYDFSWHNSGGSDLIVSPVEKLPAVQVIPIGSMDVPNLKDALTGVDSSTTDSTLETLGVPAARTLVEKCWNSVFKTIKSHHSKLSAERRAETIESLRVFYDKINSFIEDIWERRLNSVLDGQPTTRAFSVLCRELAHLTGKPFLIDPFESVESDQILETPRLILVAAVQSHLKVSVVWIPITLLAATKTVGPLIIRVVEEREITEEGGEFKKSEYLWLRDIPIHIDVFSGQPQHVVFQCIYGDSLQLVLTL